ncbi:hypothetical protein ABT093_18270 [Kitasatospora sp. NPDC002551]|uniref:hypothetical protein n=1 Tax=Kitasatospora sp. NPDC002551 TaxID=3154539 RepID=UPI003322DA56
MDVKRTGRSRKVLLAVAAAAAVGVAGCSSGGSDRAAAPPVPSDPVSASAGASAGASGTASPEPTEAPTPTGAPAPSATCADTTLLGDTELSGYLVRLPGSLRIIDLGVYMSLDGLHLDTQESKRFCAPVPVKITRFAVRMSQVGPGATGRPSYSYRPLDTVEVPLGPANGVAPGSAPPETSQCSGVLSVVHTGAPVEDTELPERLNLVTPNPAPTGPYSQQVKVTGARLVTAGLVLPADTRGC